MRYVGVHAAAAALSHGSTATSAHTLASTLSAVTCSAASSSSSSGDATATSSTSGLSIVRATCAVLCCWVVGGPGAVGRATTNDVEDKTDEALLVRGRHPRVHAEEQPGRDERARAVLCEELGQEALDQLRHLVAAGKANNAQHAGLKVCQHALASFCAAAVHRAEQGWERVRRQNPHDCCAAPFLVSRVELLRVLWW